MIYRYLYGFAMTSWIKIRGRWWIPLTKGQWYVALWCFVCYPPEQAVEQSIDLSAISHTMTLIWRQCNIKYFFFFPGILKPDDPEITPDVRSLWIRRYMERKYELMGKNSKSIPDLVLEKFGVEQELFAVVKFPVWLTNTLHINYRFLYRRGFLLVCCPVLICLLSLKQIFLFEMRPPSFK